MSEPGFRDTKQVINAILKQRAKIEECMKTGESNSLLDAVGLRRHKGYKLHQAAVSASRMPAESANDIVGYTVASLQKNDGEVDADTLLGIVPHELDGTPMQIMAGDLSKAFFEANGEDAIYSCPPLAPVGSTAAEHFPDLENLHADDSTHEQVLEELAQASASAAEATKGAYGRSQDG